MEDYRGIVVVEDLNNQDLLRDINILEERIVQDAGKQMTWHVLEVSVTKKQVEKISESLKENCYMHFWKGKSVIVVFAGPKYFEFNYEDKSTWQSVLKYTDFLEIPRNKVDFSITGL